MKYKKLLSTIAAMAIAASSFAGLGITANAKTEIASETFATAAGSNDAVNSTYGENGWTIVSTDSGQITASVADNILSLTSGTGNQRYTTYKIDTLENSADKVYKVSFNFKTNSGTVTTNNYYSVLGAVSSDSSSVSYNTSGYTTASPSELGITDTNTTYSIDLIINNSDKTVTWAVGGVVKAIKNVTATENRIIFNTGRSKTDQISNFKVYTLDLPSVTALSKDEVSLDLNGSTSDTVTVTPSSGASLSAAVSADTEVATVSTEGNVVTITGHKQGSTTVTVTVKKDGGDDFEIATDTFDVTVSDSSATPTTLTLDYKATIAGNSETVKSVGSANDAFLDTPYELTDAEKTGFEYTAESGVVYNITVTATSVEPTTAAATGDAINGYTSSCDVACTAVEKTYTATVNTVQGATVKITGTSKGGAEVDETFYSHAGTATCTGLPASGAEPYNVAVTKSGYSDGAGTLTVTDGNAASTTISSMSPTVANVLFYEDYTSDGCTDNAQNLLGNQRYKDSKLHIWGNQTIAVDTSDAEALSVSIPGFSVSTAQPGTRNRTKTVAFKNGSNNVFTITSVMTSGGTPVNTISTGAASNNSVELAVTGDISLTIDNGKITGTIGSQAISLNTVAGTPAIDSILFSGNGDAYLTFALGSITISKTNPAPVITNVTSNTVQINTLDADDDIFTKEIKPADEDSVVVVNDDVKTAGTAYLTTITIAVSNPDESQPVVTVSGLDAENNGEITVTKSEISAGSYMVQILSTKSPTITKVDYGTASTTTIN